jgi:hypothetical protein
MDVCGDRLQTAFFGENSGICKTRTQQPLTSADEFELSGLKACMVAKGA